MNVRMTGTWEVLPYQMPINPIQASLLPPVGTDRRRPEHAKNNSQGAESYRLRLQDPAGTTLASVAVQNLTYDVFAAALRPSRTGALHRRRHFDYSFKGERS
jgi:hypothetical protein